MMLISFSNCSFTLFDEYLLMTFTATVHLFILAVYTSPNWPACETQEELFEVTEHFKLCPTFSDLRNICQRGERNCERFSLKSFK